ncbi:hypothetical protein BG011_002634 [Mortierella polycephala]|uniref:Uncharacterized protein n=1 Tax=Mortierella polycephala TaxID=41804 RepID=A0A9P6U506_9FUNG|nr:hypothetical protein BG011_002634 [Mortierella polycephala]
MHMNQQGEEPNYEVNQEQLDAVDRMLEELDLDEHFDRVPAAFRIVERFEQQQQHLQGQHQEQGEQWSRSNGHSNIGNGHTSAGVDHQHHQNDEDMNSNEYTDGLDSSDDDEESGEPFGYIPLDQGDYNDEDDSDEDGEQDENENQDDTETNGHYDQMQSDEDEGEEEGQGYDGYLRRTNRDGTVPVPVIPQAVQIDLESEEEAAGPIPEEDLKTIAMVMNSISLAAPDWARSIPEERWLPKIVQQAEASLALPSHDSQEDGHPV